MRTILESMPVQISRLDESEHRLDEYEFRAVHGCTQSCPLPIRSCQDIQKTAANLEAEILCARPYATAHPDH